ncbi:sorbitol-6-phosphate dehydrogenase [Bacillus sonorensis]|uniref:Sorbitol-6-phosphate dehydrogenase n=2 Tax=Bacillus sonorensis TaxID=119858 RepID=M5PD36_9BACI|nr:MULTISPECIES: sorbitol-6-phosphate dehydrogenase [Bacillus]TWK80629.1 Sorbitol-6-phosphate 2-dehydrogenase [Bacillus paralicheniformis]ASB87081.1 3-oxoacyl-(acyl-carrier-protein) reductase FabG [Bacillus sonorensis]EME73432.1 sorbitol-6-phosphate dehydrogenase [Bacillus sonorensis L12]MBG9914411.1 sorbitol-6-phosphate 2-dehydrogenase [Bacillus sonorensis]MCY7857740.1 sorbitol-6-phosphate dehydrogenase [Bacillus sonorensis]
MEMNEGKTALICGGGQSLGEALSYRMAEAGYDVAVADINGENAKKTADQAAEKYGKKSLAIEADFTKENDVKRMIENVSAAFGKIDVMVYSAGIAKSNKIIDFQLKDWEKTIDVNLTGYFLCAKETAKVMIEQGSGSIIQINSKSGKVGSKHNTAYSASKFGGVGLTQSLALDLAEHNIRVNSIMPGNLLKSPMFQSLIPQYAKKLGIPESEVERVYTEKVPLKRGCTYDDIANAVLFYASDQASYMTGQSINVTGGQVMH